MANLLVIVLLEINQGFMYLYFHTSPTLPPSYPTPRAASERSKSPSLQERIRRGLQATSCQYVSISKALTSIFYFLALSSITASLHRQIRCLKGVEEHYFLHRTLLTSHSPTLATITYKPSNANNLIGPTI